MQRVVRSTLAVLTLAGLAACGDKVTIPPQVVQTTTPVTPVVHGVTVSPTQASMNVGDKITISASVNADSPLARTVTWKSSDATIASVDAAGLVTALKVGTASITATSTADGSQSASAVVTVGGGNGTPGGNATVTISTINQTLCGVGGGCASVPANLANVAGQLDVTLNVDPGNQRLLGVDLVLNCTGAGNSGKDTVVASQTLATANVAPAADAAAAPVTLSFNTASFNGTTGATLFKNGACTVKAVARTNSSVGGAVTTTTSTGLSLTLANPDVVVGTVTSGAQALNPNTGLTWNGKSVTVSTIPVFFTNRTAAQTVVTLAGRTVHLGAGAQSVTFVDDNDPSIGPVLGGAVTKVDTLDIDGLTTDLSLAGMLAVNIVDSNGQSFANAGNILASTPSYLANPGAPASTFTQPFRLDTQKPVSGTLVLGGNGLQNTGVFASGAAYLNGSFRFASDSAAGYVGPDRLSAAATCTSSAIATPTNVTSNCDNGGVDSVSVSFYTGTVASSGAIGTLTKATGTTALAESNTNSTYALVQVTVDRLNNADTTISCNNGSYVAGTGCAQFSTVQNVTGVASASGARFGVDKTAPTQAFTAGEANNGVFTNPSTPGNYFLTITDVGTVGGAGVGTYAGTNTILAAQTREWNGFRSTSSVSGFENHVYSNLAGATPGTGSALRTTGESLRAINGENSGCVVGRFNASAANAGANALKVYASDSTVMGYCTPVAIAPTLGPGFSQGLPADAAVATGLYRTEIVPVDLANNTGTPFLSAIYVDNAAPVVINMDIPQTIAGNNTVTFPATVADTGTSRSTTAGDIVGSWATISYTNGTVLQYAVTAGPGVAFDNALTNTATVAPAVPNFIKNLQLNNGAAAPTAVAANVNNLNSVSVAALDAANQTGANTVTFASQPVSITGSSSSYSGFTGGFGITAANANGTNVQNCPAAGCGTGTANPSTITVTATASGTSGTFSSPFATTQVWYRATAVGGTWFMATPAQAAQGTTTFTDAGVSRAWNYVFTFDPPSATPAGTNLSPAAATTIGLDVMVIGIDGNGNAVATPVQTITLTNP